ncbi:hypothetical protein [Thalassovita aquimarina]|uniref:DUF4935 domain-containing protein n=1 Tax=Thalassovita aquimarina TaxID=2785917 RepID=A0ABS5HX41_9RHOB|nr:hypothetical protein [Thalassovita aquimarina]MBR9653552.1 hypothetical protein [Thalassovita aquimarina]
MPLIVYLDTQDYINLFNEPDDGTNHQVLSELLEYRDNGAIVIGFSIATIVEFITKPDITNRSERVRRGQLIKNICGANAFPNFSDLAKGASFPNDGKWILKKDQKIISAKQFRRQMHEILIEELAKTEGLNRAQRRQLGRKSSMHELVRKKGSTWGRKRSDYGELPVSDEIVESRILERFMKGLCSDSEFEKRMNAWLSDPAEYSRIVYDYADHPNVIDKYFGKSIDDIENAVQSMQNLVSATQKLNAEMLSTRSVLIDAGIDKSKARKLTKQRSLPEFDPDKVDAKLEELLGKGRSRHFQHYLARVMKPGYTFKRSDMMDLMQMCYAYDCDLFRCDKSMANTFSNFEPFKGKLVGRFTELPKRIDALISS